jgi:SAM-dependent methyltransferase/methyltransferase-like protein
MAAGEDFESLPYPSLPQSYAQPAHLAALSQLFGLTAPAVETARVLELGCAAGGHIITLAARFPRSKFAGIDLSSRHIADGQRRIASLALSNIELREGDVTRLLLTGQKFDYIICHGLFSWVPQAAQDAILRLVRDTLAPDGVAAISYNVLPGWHLRRVIRDICRSYAGTAGTAAERVAKARRALDDIAQSASEKQLYGQLLRQEAKRLARQPSAYILGEFLAENNTPLMFSDFADRATRHGVKFLCEGDLNASAHEMLFHDGGTALQDVAKAQVSDKQMAAEQALDFASGRPFRRSLLVHAERVVEAPDANRLRGLHVLGELQRDEKSSTAKDVVFKDRTARLLTVKSGVVSATLQRLAAIYPSSIAVDSLLADLGVVDARHVDETLLALVTAGHMSVSSQPIRAGLASIALPLVPLLNRLEAADGQPWITSLHHEAIPVTPLQSVVVRHLDGRSDRKVLTERVAAAFQSAAKKDAAQSPAQFVEATLFYLELNGVLAPSHV